MKIPHQVFFIQGLLFVYLLLFLETIIESLIHDTRELKVIIVIVSHNNLVYNSYIEINNIKSRTNIQNCQFHSLATASFSKGNRYANPFSRTSLKLTLIFLLC